MNNMATAQRSEGNGPVQALAGKTFRLAFYWREKRGGAIRNADDYVATVQLKDLHNKKKVILNLEESNAPNAVFFRDSDPETFEQRWLLQLGKSYTSWLPNDLLLEAELTNTGNPDDVEPLVPGLVIKIEPEGVMQ